MEPSLLVDRDDNTIWTLDFADEGIRLAELSLPDGNRLVGVQSKQQAPQLNHWNFYYVHEPILVGSISSYQWTVAGFVKSDTPAARPWWLRYCTSEVGETSLAEMTVRLRKIDENGAVGTDSEIVFEQRYEPRNLREHGRVALMRFGMLCGPPALSTQWLIAGSSAPLLHGLLPGPAALPKDFAGLHVLHVLLGLALAALTWRSVARRGGTRAERVLWSLFVLLFGVFAACFLLMLAPRPSPATNPRAERAAAKTSAASLAAT
jgi:hypothetical protein